MSSKSLPIMLLIVRQREQSLKINTPTYFGLGVWFTLNLLMHDIIKLKENEHKWIGELYKKGKHMISFITNHSNAHGIFRAHSKLELLKITKTRFASYYLTFRHLLKVREALADKNLLKTRFVEDGFC